MLIVLTLWSTPLQFSTYKVKLSASKTSGASQNHQ